MDDEPTPRLSTSSVVRRPSSIPRLALIADGFTDTAVAERVVDAAHAGVPWIHLRDHAASSDAFSEAARAMAERLRKAAPGVLISVNSRLAAASALDAGLHTGRHGPPVGEARRRLGAEALVGCSAHDEAEAQAAADYYFFSPVFPTDSKPGHPGAGLPALRRFCQAFPETPVLALGGLTPARVGPCLDAGAHGVAVLSGILHADDSSRATDAYLQAFPEK